MREKINCYNNSMNTKIKNKIIKTIATALVALSFASYTNSGVCYAVNEQFDNPDDNRVSQNEAYEDLLNETVADAPSITASGYALIDTQTGAVLLGRNVDEQFEPASTTKVMTVLLALENLSLDDTITVNQDMYIALQQIPEGYTLLGMTINETFTVKDLVYAALLKSANDATLVLAMHMGGTQLNFCQMMNQRATEIGCTNTNFTNAYGLSEPTHLTTARDLALIIGEATKNETFCEISCCIAYSIKPTNVYNETREISNANKFISTQEYSYDYYIGGKTGYTDVAGYTLCSAAVKNDRKLVGAILGSTNTDIRYSDMIKLFECGFSSFTTISIDYSEYSAIVNQTLELAKTKLIDTELEVTEYDYIKNLSPYLTLTTSRVTSGCVNEIDLSVQVIDISVEDQTLVFPLLKVFGKGTADEKTYIVGSLTMHITTKDKVIEIQPEKHTGLEPVKAIAKTILTISILVIILSFCLLVLRKKLKRKRRYNK